MHVIFLFISDIRIPLMWKDTDHFKNKGGKKVPFHFVYWIILNLIEEGKYLQGFC